jgi:hypothetical protein
MEVADYWFLAFAILGTAFSLWVYYVKPMVDAGSIEKARDEYDRKTIAQIRADQKQYYENIVLSKARMEKLDELVNTPPKFESIEDADAWAAKHAKGGNDE